MPLYEYKCTACGHRYEMREGFDAPATQACTNCGQVAKRVFSPPPIVFKGSGFYITDSRKGSQVTVSDSTVSPPSPAPKPSEESKPAPAASSSDD